ncbi:MAG: mechanosensitive ion channel [Candidatus Eremiobacteraeota bacterium]|nr:mechanosensitive ion channel [Candidatus Eremiobacteraeota bacterium]
MHDGRILAALGCLAAGIVFGLGAEWLVGRVPRLKPLRWVALAALVLTGAYGAAIALQGGHPRPVTHRVYVSLWIVMASLVVSRLAGALVIRHGHRAGAMVSVSVFVSVIEAVVLVLGGLVLLDFLGISVAPILTAFGIGGLAVALALQDTLSNFFAGIQIAASGQIHAGDFVKIEGDSSGRVIDINWRNTTVEDADCNRVVIPNQKLATSVFTNFRRPLHADIPLSVDRSADVEKIARVARESAEKVRAAEGRVDVQFVNVTTGTIELLVRIPAEHVAETPKLRSDFAREFAERVKKNEPV